MLKLMNLIAILLFVFGFGCFVSEPNRTIRKIGIACIALVAIFSIYAIPTTRHNGFVSRAADVAFTATAHNLFVDVKSRADGLLKIENPTAGTIVLKDSSTALITSNRETSSSGLSQEKFYTIPLKSSDSTLQLTGSLSSNNKNWCFKLTTRDKHASNTAVIYTEKGFVATDGYCLDGLAYDNSDTLIQ